MDADARLNLNMNVLKRHDPSITEIMESASFVVLYSHDKEWTKTGIEGPMFLFRRTRAPHYGFFILNRNGVENFSADMTPDDDLELTPDFIIYRPGSSDDNEIYGIWIFESAQRQSIGEQMMKLQNMPAPAHEPSSSNIASLPAAPVGGQAISLDDLFGTSSAASNGSVIQSGSTATAPPPPPPTGGTSLLDTIFQSAASAPQPTPSASAAPSTPQPSHSAPAVDPTSDALKALLGMAPTAPIRTTSDDSRSLAEPPKQTQFPAQPSGLQALFASARVSSPAHAPPSPAHASSFQSAPLTNGTQKAPATPQASREAEKENQKQKQKQKNGLEPHATAELVDGSLDGKIGAAGDETSLSRRDFVRELLALIHTEPKFVDDLYTRYQARSGPDPAQR